MTAAKDALDVAQASCLPPCPPEEHEDWKMVWRHQGDGFNYFYCHRCNWQKPDLEAPVFKALCARVEAEAVRRERERAKPLVGTVEQLLESHANLYLCLFTTPNADPEKDLVRREAKKALAAYKTPTEGKESE